MGELQKLKILDADSKGSKKAVLLEAQFNPTELSFSKSVEWGDNLLPKVNISNSYFSRGLAMEFSFTLFMDTTSNKDENIYTKYIPQLKKISEINVEKHRPPLLLISWGALNLIRCVVKSIDYDFTMFNKAGAAIRGTAKLSFKQVAGIDEKIHKTKDVELQSPDHSKVRTLREGDSLQSIAYDEYEDVNKWKILAEHNNIEDPLNITAGTIIKLPALKD